MGATGGWGAGGAGDGLQYNPSRVVLTQPIKLFGPFVVFKRRSALGGECIPALRIGCSTDKQTQHIRCALGRGSCFEGGCLHTKCLCVNLRIIPGI